MAFLIFSTEVSNFSDMTSSFIYTLSYVMGLYTFKEMQIADSIVGPIFFTFVIVQTLLFITIFRAIILGNVTEEYKLAQVLAPEQQEQWITTILFRIIQTQWSANKENWRWKNTKILTPLFEVIDKWMDPENKKKDEYVAEFDSPPPLQQE